jgi:2-dehydropantoate 2-reductase
VRILVVGAGVIGSVYGAKLAQVGHDVVLLARGHRLADLQTGGLPLVDAQSGQRLALPAPVVATVPPGTATTSWWFRCAAISWAAPCRCCGAWRAALRMPTTVAIRY